MLRAIVYCRESRDDGGERYERIETQRDILLRYCQKVSLTPVHIVMDDNKSGTEFGRLTVVKRWIETEKIDAFVAKDASRIGRDQLESLMFIRFLEERGVRLFLESEQYDEKLFGLFAWLNERRAKEDGEKIRRVLRHKMESGDLLIKAPYGYRIINGEMTIVPKEAQRVRWIFETYLNGAGMSDMARLLAKEVPAEKWSCQKVSRILRNESYCGTYLMGKTCTVNHRQRRETDPVIIKNHHRAIVTAELFERVQARLFKRNRVALHKYAGILVCADCGSPFTRRNYTNGYGFVCSAYNRDGNRRCKAHKMMQVDLDRILTDALTELLIVREMKWRNKEQSYGESKETILKEIEKIEENITRLYEDSLLPGFPRTLLERKLKEYSNRKNELEARSRIDEPISHIPIPQVELNKETISVITNRIVVDQFGKIKVYVK